MIILFPFVGIWLWLYVFVSFIGLCTWTYRDMYRWCSADAVLFLALLSVTGHINVFGFLHYAKENPLILLGWVVAYLAIGIVWARLKWQLLLRRVKAKCEKWRKDHSQGKDQFEASLYRSDLSIIGVKLEADGKFKIDMDFYKSRIKGWIAFWHVSALLWIVGDFLRDVIDTCFRLIRKHLESAANAELNDV
jgi:hypothetical protein